MNVEQRKKISETLKLKFKKGILVCPWKGKIRSPEHIEKLRLVNKERKRSKEWCEMMSKLHTGNKYNLGRKQTPESIKKQIESIKKNLPCTIFKKGQIPWNRGKKGLHSWMKGKHHTKEVKEKISRACIGKNKGILNHNWKGGITPINRFLRANSQWKIWRELVFLRDNFTCQNPNCEYCHNQIGVTLHPHHIKPLARIIKENNNNLEEVLNCKELWDINNGITYCKKFHIQSRLLHKYILKEVN